MVYCYLLDPAQNIINIIHVTTYFLIYLLDYKKCLQFVIFMLVSPPPSTPLPCQLEVGGRTGCKHGNRQFSYVPEGWTQRYR